MSETGSHWFERELHVAAGDGDLEGVKRLLQQGTDPNAFDDLGWTPLIHAAKRGYVGIVACLLAAGAKVDERDEARAGNTALAEVAAECSLAMAKTLIDAGADPRLPGGYNSPRSTGPRNGNEAMDRRFTGSCWTLRRNARKGVYLADTRLFRGS